MTDRSEHTEIAATDPPEFQSEPERQREAIQAAVKRTALLQAVNEVLELGLRSSTVEGLATACLKVAEQFTGSEFGFIGQVNEAGVLNDLAVGDLGWEACKLYDKMGHRRPPGEFVIHGLYGRVIDDGTGFFTNDPTSHPDSIGTPPGHPQLSAFLGVPLMSGGRVGGIVAVANKPGGYEPDDQLTLEALAPAIVEAFERQRAERELADAAQRLDAHINNSPLAVIEFDNEFRVARWSDDAEAMFGWSAEEVLGKAITEIPWVYEADTELVDEESSRLAEGAGRSVNVNRNYRKDGSVIWCEWYDSALYDADGKIISILSQVLDITERRAAQAALEESEQRLRDILETIPMGISVITPDGQLLYGNAEFRNLVASSAKTDGPKDAPDLLRLSASSVETGLPLELDQRPAVRAFRTGEVVTDELVQIQLSDGTSITNQVSVTPLKDKDGRISSALVVAQNVSVRRERERYEAALNDISAAIMATLDSDVVLSRLVELSREALQVDIARLTVREHGNWVIRRLVPEGARIPSVSALEDPLLESALLDAKEHRPLAIDDVRTDPRVDPKYMKQLGIRSLLVAPIVVHHEVVGALVFHHHNRAVVFSAAQVEFAERLMGIATLALENARLYERERRIADTLQEAVLTPLEQVPGLRAGVVYRPASASANIGGDFYDLFTLDDGRVGIVVGDVSGKGIEAARFTSLLHDAIRAYAYEDPAPSNVLRRVNVLVHRLSPPEMFATVFCGVLDPTNGRLAYSVAGHPLPALVGAGGAHPLDGEVSPILGAFADATFEACDARIGRGEMLVLYTDGIIEARGEHGLFGEQRLLEALTRMRHTSAHKTPNRLLSTALEYAGGKLHDDTIVLAVKVPRRLGGVR